MMMFLTLLSNLIPLYVLIGLGFIAGRWLDVNLKSIVRLNIFIFWPFVVFIAIARMDFNLSYLLLPLILWCISCIITFLSYQTSKRIWPDNGNANLIGAGSVNGNPLYFGLPLILLFFGPQMAGLYLFMNVGPMLNNMSLAYFLTARGRYSLAQSFVRLLRFPALHASWLGLCANVLGLHVPDIVVQYWDYAAGTMISLGMMMIGIAIGELRKLEFDFKFTVALLIVKFMLWPIFVSAFVFIDILMLALFSTEIHQMMLLFSVMPLMGNLVAYAAEHDLNPARVATTVLVSCFLTFLIIPAMLMLAGIY